jgi:FtsP/CotA-like multicopper oxidase with cupredoxin domain
MDRTRRNFLQGAALLSAVIATRSAANAREDSGRGEMQMPKGMETNHGGMSIPRQSPHGMASDHAEFLPVVTPDVSDLPFDMENGVKVFHLIAEPVKQELIPGKTVNLWGYNGSAPGPTIQAKQGDRVRIIVDNHLPEPTSMHWHGFDIPFDMDGGPGLSQDPIRPGNRFVYEFTLNQEGTYFYHSHMAMQEMMGMIGAFIMHPKEPYDPPVDKDFAIILQEYAILPNNPTPNSMNMEFNWLTFNGKSGPASTPLIVRLGDRVRLRFVNLGMDHHPIHLHGHQFVITGTEGGRQPKATWGPNNTVLVGVAQARMVEFVANNPGNWMIHCHLPHHMMNQMSSNVGPMTRRPGIVAGASMEEGMGMPREGGATAETNGPSVGRGMGVGSTLEQVTSNGLLSKQKMQPQTGKLNEMPGMQMQMQTGKADVTKDANSIPGFPQDAFMEGPVMAMDEMFQKPETFGLRPGWSGFMQGMTTLLRVLPPDQYDHIMELRKRQGSTKPDEMPGIQHHLGK